MTGANRLYRRFRQSNAVVPEGMVIGSDYSIHPIEGQLQLFYLPEGASGEYAVPNTEDFHNA